MSTPQEFIKILNKEKVLEFKTNEKTNSTEAEISLENNTDQPLISKIYINHHKHFKCSSTVIITSPKSKNNVKVFLTNNQHNITNEDIFLILSHPLIEKLNINEIDNKKADEIFKSNKIYKEKGQKIFLVCYHDKKEEIIKDEDDKSELMNKIRELQKQLYKEPESMKKEEKKKEIENKKGIENNKNEDSKNGNKESKNSTYIYVGLGILVLAGSYFIYKMLKKSK